MRYDCDIPHHYAMCSWRSVLLVTICKTGPRVPVMCGMAPGKLVLRGALWRPRLQLHGLTISGMHAVLCAPKKPWEAHWLLCCGPANTKLT